MQTYLGDGRLPIDNNDAEQLMKQIALGRKNRIFIRSVAAGERAADFLTLVSGAVRNDLDVWAYLKDVLDQLLAGSTHYESLRPDVGRQAHPDFVRQYRAQERRDRGRPQTTSPRQPPAGLTVRERAKSPSITRWSRWALTSELQILRFHRKRATFQVLTYASTIGNRTPPTATGAFGGGGKVRPA